MQSGPAPRREPQGHVQRRRWWAPWAVPVRPTREEGARRFCASLARRLRHKCGFNENTNGRLESEGASAHKRTHGDLDATRSRTQANGGRRRGCLAPPSPRSAAPTARVRNEAALDAAARAADAREAEAPGAQWRRERRAWGQSTSRGRERELVAAAAAALRTGRRSLHLGSRTRKEGMSTARRKVEVGGPQGVRGESRAGQETEEEGRGEEEGKGEDMRRWLAALCTFLLCTAQCWGSLVKKEKDYKVLCRLIGVAKALADTKAPDAGDAAKGIAKGTLEGLRLAAGGVAGVNATRVTSCAEEMGLLAAGKVSEKTRGAAAGAEERRLRQLVLTVKEALQRATQLHATGKRRALDALYGDKKTDVKDANFHCKAQAASLSSGNTPLTSSTHGIGKYLAFDTVLLCAKDAADCVKHNSDGNTVGQCEQSGSPTTNAAERWTTLSKACLKAVPHTVTHDTVATAFSAFEMQLLDDEDANHQNGVLGPKQNTCNSEGCIQYDTYYEANTGARKGQVPWHAALVDSVGNITHMRRLEDDVRRAAEELVRELHHCDHHAETPQDAGSQGTEEETHTNQASNASKDTTTEARTTKAAKAIPTGQETGQAQHDKEKPEETNACEQCAATTRLLATAVVYTALAAHGFCA
ncbi:hypothetical protein ERJ75_001815800 [Trypanosoma vivax]|nr:hypothetical protein ERJ75_001815800 [Trypanosoma vivax]